MEATRTIQVTRRCGDFRRLVITDRGSYQRVTLFDRHALIGEFAYSADENGIYDCWPLHGACMTLAEMRGLRIAPVCPAWAETEANGKLRKDEENGTSS